jgi:hypothetical protein
MLASAGWSAIGYTTYELTVTVERDALFDDAQLAYLGVPDHHLGSARSAVDQHLAGLRGGDGRYQAPLAFQVFTASG